MGDNNNLPNMPNMSNIEGTGAALPEEAAQTVKDIAARVAVSAVAVATEVQSLATRAANSIRGYSTSNSSSNSAVNSHPVEHPSIVTVQAEVTNYVRSIENLDDEINREIISLKNLNDQIPRYNESISGLPEEYKQLSQKEEKTQDDIIRLNEIHLALDNYNEFAESINKKQKSLSKLNEDKIEIEKNLKTVKDKLIQAISEDFIDSFEYGFRRSVAAYKIIQICPIEKPTLEEEAAESTRKERALANPLSDDLSIDLDYIGPSVRSIALSEGVAPKDLDKIVHEVNIEILKLSGELLKDAAIFAATGSVVRLIGANVQIPMIAEFLQGTATAMGAPKLETMAWIVSKIGSQTLSNELTIIAVEAAERSAVAQYQIALFLGGTDAVAALVNTATTNAQTAARTLNEAQRKLNTVEKGTVAYDLYNKDVLSARTIVAETAAAIKQLNTLVNSETRLGKVLIEIKEQEQIIAAAEKAKFRSQVIRGQLLSPASTPLKPLGTRGFHTNQVIRYDVGVNEYAALEKAIQEREQYKIAVRELAKSTVLKTGKRFLGSEAEIAEFVAKVYEVGSKEAKVVAGFKEASQKAEYLTKEYFKKTNAAHTDYKIKIEADLKERRSILDEADKELTKIKNNLEEAQIKEIDTAFKKCDDEIQAAITKYNAEKSRVRTAALLRDKTIANAIKKRDNAIKISVKFEDKLLQKLVEIDTDFQSITFGAAISKIEQMRINLDRYLIIIDKISTAIKLNIPGKTPEVKLFINLFSKGRRGGIYRGDTNAFLRTFAGRNPGEHSFTVEEFMMNLYDGAYRGYFPTVDEMTILTQALKSSIQPLDVNINKSLNRLVSKVKSNSQITYEQKFRDAFDSLTKIDKRNIIAMNKAKGTKITDEMLKDITDDMLKNDNEINAALAYFHEQREKSFLNIVEELVVKNQLLINTKHIDGTYIKGFVENMCGKSFEWRVGFDPAKEIRDRIGIKSIGGIDRNFIEQYLPKTAEKLQQTRSAVGRSTVGQTKTALATSSPGQTTRWMSTSRPAPLDARISIKDFQSETQGDRLRAMVPANLHASLGVPGKGSPVPVVKEVVFKYLVATGKVNAPAHEIELQLIRFKIAAKERVKTYPKKAEDLALLRAQEAELLAKHGENKSLPRSAPADAAIPSGDALLGIEEQTVQNLGYTAPQSTKAVINSEEQASQLAKTQIEKLLAEKAAAEKLAESSKAKPSLGETKNKQDGIALSADSAAASTAAKLESEVFVAGTGSPSKVNIPEVQGYEKPTLPQITAASDEAALAYSRIHGKSEVPLLTREGMKGAADAQGIVATLIDPVKSAVSLIEVIKAYTPYGMSLRRLKTMLKISPANIERFGVFARDLAEQPMAIAKYNELVETGLKLILENATRVQINKLITVFTPQRLIEFKTAMTGVFSHSIQDATTVLNIMVTQVIPGSKYNAQLIDALIFEMRAHPQNAVTALQTMTKQVLGEEIKTLAASAQALEKGMGWFKSKTYYTLLLGGGGASVLFLANLANIPDLKIFSEKVSDKVSDIYKDIEEDPRYENVKEVSRKIRDAILVDLLGQVPPPPPEPAEPVRAEWSDSIMSALGYDPKKAADRRKFAEMAQKVKEVAANTAITAGTAAVAAAVAAGVKLALSRP